MQPNDLKHFEEEGAGAKCRDRNGQQLSAHAARPDGVVVSPGNQNRWAMMLVHVIPSSTIRSATGELPRRDKGNGSTPGDG
jgi:hypothetical protein